MKQFYPPRTDKDELPSSGKLNVRFRQMRGVWQVFAGNVYINIASGETPDDAIEELLNNYNVKSGSKIITHWTKNIKLETVV